MKDHISIPPPLLELWAQVAVRGELDEQGNFVPWDEPTWEVHRQQLAAAPPPYPDFPFPGYLATDRLHWLRLEYEYASEDDKPALARRLLERAEALGDRAEADRWREIVSPRGEEAKEAAPAADLPENEAGPEAGGSGEEINR